VQNLLQHHDAIGNDDAAFAFLAFDNVRLGTVGRNGNADHSDLASMLLEFLDRLGKFLLGLSIRLMLLRLRGKLLLSPLSLLCGLLEWLFVGRFFKHRTVVGAWESYACGSRNSIEAIVN